MEVASADVTWDVLKAKRFLDTYDYLYGQARTYVVHRQLQDHLPRPPARILDIGGGAGHQSIPLARDRYDVPILEPEEHMLDAGRRCWSARLKTSGNE